MVSLKLPLDNTRSCFILKWIKNAKWPMLKECRVAKNVKSNAEWLKNVKKYTHYLNYENYSQSVLSKLISGSFALVSFADDSF